MTCGLGIVRGCFDAVCRSLPHNVKAKTGRALVTPINCDARIRCLRLVPMFDDLLNEFHSSAGSHSEALREWEGKSGSSLTRFDLPLPQRALGAMRKRTLKPWFWG